MAERDRRPRGEEVRGGQRKNQAKEEKKRRDGEERQSNKKHKATTKERAAQISRKAVWIGAGRDFYWVFERNCHLMYIVVKRERPHANKSMSFNGP